MYSLHALPYNCMMFVSYKQNDVLAVRSCRNYVVQTASYNHCPSLFATISVEITEVAHENISMVLMINYHKQSSPKAWYGFLPFIKWR